MAIVFNLGIVVIILGLTWALMSEGLWGAVLMFFNILFAGLVAFNFYEPLAALLASNVEFITDYADLLCFTLLFGITLVILRLTTESLAPAMVRFPTPVYHLGRVAFGFLGAVLAMGIILNAYNLAPVHKKLFGVYSYDSKPPFGLGLDRVWLGLMQHTSGTIFTRNSDTSDPEFGQARVFDRTGEWLIRHEEVRPFGEGWREEFARELEADAGPVAGGEGGATGDPAQAGVGGAPAGPGIPGGTAGAATGLAPTNPF